MPASCTIASTSSRDESVGERTVTLNVAWSGVTLLVRDAVTVTDLSLSVVCATKATGRRNTRNDEAARFHMPRIVKENASYPRPLRPLHSSATTIELAGFLGSYFTLSAGAFERSAGTGRQVTSCDAVYSTPRTS